MIFLLNYNDPRVVFGAGGLPTVSVARHSEPRRRFYRQTRPDDVYDRAPGTFAPAKAIIIVIKCTDNARRYTCEYAIQPLRLLCFFPSVLRFRSYSTRNRTYVLHGYDVTYRLEDSTTAGEKCNSRPNSTVTHGYLFLRSLNSEYFTIYSNDLPNPRPFVWLRNDTAGGLRAGLFG